ncbi:MAG: tetratricopeptide repeat protein [Candidatus Omnitrophica bacterium]|nr:tetratricopeptide repeat protein [Candidatus Omnitrophota bacterium]
MTDVFKPQRRIVYLSIFLLGFLIYANVLNGEFVSDDYVCIVDNDSIKSLDLSDIYTSYRTRFLTGLTFALNYSVYQLDVTGYHIVNILFHILAACLVFTFLRWLFKTPALISTVSESAAFQISTASAFIFLCHPIQTQGVAFITQRAVALGTCFYLVALIGYLKGRITGRNRFMVMGFCAMLLGMISKEMTLTIPIMIFLMEVFLLDGLSRRTFFGLRKVWPFLIGYIFFPILFLQRNTGSYLDLRGQFLNGMFDWSYFRTELNVLVTYLRFFILPVGQNHEHDVIISHSWLDPIAWGSAIILAFLIFLGVRQYQKNRIVSFSIFWFFIATSVEFVVVCVVKRKPIDEHWMYLSVVGLSLWFAYSAYIILKNDRMFRRVMSVIVFLLCLMTVHRNIVWQTEIGFWVDSVSKASRRNAYLGLGIAYTRKGQLDQAIRAYSEGLQKNPTEERLFTNFGQVFMKKNQLNEALQVYKEGLRLNPANENLLNNLGIVYMKKDRVNEAIQTFRYLISVHPEFSSGYYNLGYAYYLIHQDRKAIEMFKKSAEDPIHAANAHYYMAECYFSLNLTADGEKNLRIARSLYEKNRDVERVYSIDERLKEL